MAEYSGNLRIGGDDAPPVGVEIDLTEDKLRVTASGAELGEWTRDEIRVQALRDGFHLRVEGEEVILDVSDDARFALDLGLRTAHPALRRRMSALMRDDVS